jgi:hypothetical protein
MLQGWGEGHFGRTPQEKEALFKDMGINGRTVFK